MIAKLDITGQIFGRLTAKQRVVTASKRSHWLFSCSCGNEVVRGLEPVRAGFTQSCGCLRVETTRARSLTHGQRVNRTTTKTHKAYQHAKSRCTNPNDEKFPRYGGRGVKMCDTWMASFEAFHAYMGDCPDGMTLDRIDVDGDYAPGNCRWATNREQSRNRSDNVYVEDKGDKLVLKDFAARYEVNYKTLHAAVKYKGMTPHEAVSAIRRTSTS